MAVLDIINDYLSLWPDQRHVHKYEAVFDCFVDILIIYFLLTYKMGISYAPIINRINYLSEKVLCSINDKIETEIYLKSLGTIKDKKVTLVV